MDSLNLNRIWLKGGDEFDSLDDVDKQRLLFLERRAIILMRNRFWST